MGPIPPTAHSPVPSAIETLPGSTGPVPQVLAEWCTELAGKPRSTAVDTSFRARLLDFAANLAGGQTTAAAISMRAYLERYGRTEAGRQVAEVGAMANAVAAHALECDDTHQPSSTHPGAVVLSAALAMADEIGGSLEDVARATIVGYELLCRLGEAACPASQYARGFHPTSTCGAFGAAAAAGMLLDLSTDRLASALALASSFASGSMSFLTGGWSKPLNVGHAASAGVAVARLADAGYQGPTESIVGPHGFLRGHSETPRPIALEPPLGEFTLAIERTSLKMHGCCRYEQGPIDALLELRRTAAFTADDVASVRIGMLTAGWHIVVHPLPQKRRPSTIVEAQFSMPFGAALAIVLGHAGPFDHSPRLLADPRIRRVMDQVECYTDPELDAEYPAHWPAAVELTLRDGSRLEKRVDFPKGDPENPLSVVELQDKLAHLAPDAPHRALIQAALEDPLDRLGAAEFLSLIPKSGGGR